MKTVWHWQTGTLYEAGRSSMIFATKELAEEAQDTWVQTRCAHWADRRKRYTEAYEGDRLKEILASEPEVLTSLEDIEYYTDDWSCIQEVVVIGS